MGSRIAFLLLLTVAILLNSPPVFKSKPVQVIRHSIQSAAYPLHWCVSKTAKGAGAAFGFFIKANKFEKQSELLSAALDKAEAELMKLKSAAEENQELRSALEFKDYNPYGYSLIPVEVIAWGGGDANLIIDHGSADGIKEGQTVISRSGLVGKVGEVSLNSSKVILLTDSMSVVSAVLPRTNTYGVVHGGRVLKMNYVPESASVEAGEEVIVSSASSAFKKGLPIGTVSSVSKKVEDLFQRVEISPAVDFSKLEVLYICRP